MTRVLLVGLGALGSTAAELLCRAGYTELTLCDFDIVQEDNLQRQALYTMEDVGSLKVEAAAKRLTAINPSCAPRMITEPFSEQTPLDVDIILEGTDSLQARLLINDAAKQAGIPCVFGAAADTKGFVYSGCWQCVAQGKTATDTCDDGILNTTVHAVASMQVQAVFRIRQSKPWNTLIELDMWNGTTRHIAVHRNPQCKACSGSFAYLTAPVTFHYCTATNRLQARPTKPRTINLDVLTDVKKRYSTACLVQLDDGTALVHKHGTVEFEHVEEKKAKKFMQHLR